MRAVVALVAGFAGTLPATAQTFEEAVWANTSLALQLCISGVAPSETRAAWFRDAGFAEFAERTGGDTTHIFTAPAETVEVELYYGHLPEHCLVSSQHMGVGRAGQLLDALIPQLFPTYVRKVREGLCVTYEDPSNPIGHVVGVLAADDQGCVENGTAEFYSSYRV